PRCANPTWQAVERANQSCPGLVALPLDAAHDGRLAESHLDGDEHLVLGHLQRDLVAQTEVAEGRADRAHLHPIGGPADSHAVAQDLTARDIGVVHPPEQARKIGELLSVAIRVLGAVEVVAAVVALDAPAVAMATGDLVRPVAAALPVHLA